MTFPKLSLNQALVMTVVATLLPIGAFSIALGYSNRNFSEQLVRQQIVTHALLAGAKQSRVIELAQRGVGMLAHDPDIVEAGKSCAPRLAEATRALTAVRLTRRDEKGFVLCEGSPRNAAGDVARFAPIVTNAVTTKSGAVGSIRADLDIDALQAALDKNRISRSSIAVIADRNGHAVHSVPGVAIPQFDVALSFADAVRGESADGNRWIYASAPLLDRRLFIVYAEPEQRLIAPILATFRLDLVLAVLTILLTSIVVWWGVNAFVIRWLHRIGALATELAQGRFDAATDRFDGAPVEIEALGTDLSRMASAIAQRNEALEAAATVTKTMAREVNHRVKNNLQMVISLLELQSTQITDTSARFTLEQTRMRIGALALIYRLHYDVGALAEQGVMDLRVLLGELLKQLHMTFGRPANVRIDWQSDVERLPVDQAIPFALFLVEAVSNALRHGFPEARSGTITISFTHDGDELDLVIADDGVGYDPAVVGKSIGMELMRAFATQLDGHVEMTGALTGGTRTYMRFKVPE